MKKWILALPLVVLALISTSCLKHDNETPIKFYETMATVISADEYPSFQSDNGTIYNCTNSIKSDTSVPFKNGERFFLRFAFEDTIGHLPKIYPIVLYNFGKVTIKDFVTIQKDSTDSYASKSLHSIYFIWTSGDYFNAAFRSFVSFSTRNTFELVRVLKNENNLPGNTVPGIYLELRHNTDTINTMYYESRLKLFSFNLNKLLTEFPAATQFKLHLKWIEGTTGIAKSYDLDYIPNIHSIQNAGSPGVQRNSGLPPASLQGTFPSGF